MLQETISIFKTKIKLWVQACIVGINQLNKQLNFELQKEKKNTNQKSYCLSFAPLLISIILRRYFSKLWPQNYNNFNLTWKFLLRRLVTCFLLKGSWPWGKNEPLFLFLFLSTLIELTTRSKIFWQRKKNLNLTEWPKKDNVETILLIFKCKYNKAYNKENKKENVETILPTLNKNLRQNWKLTYIP